MGGILGAPVTDGRASPDVAVVPAVPVPVAVAVKVEVEVEGSEDGGER
jgi:hypothetical protein